MTMNRAWALSCFLVAVVSVGGGLRAQDKGAADKGAAAQKGRQLLEGPQFEGPPVAAPEAFRKLMKSNDAVMSVDAPASAAEAAGAPVPSGRQTTFRGTLTPKLGEMPDYEAALKEAATLKANFAEIEAFFTGTMKSPSGTGFAKAGLQAVSDLETALKAKKRTDAINGQIHVAEVCRECHIAHRILVITQPLGFAIVP